MNKTNVYRDFPLRTGFQFLWSVESWGGGGGIYVPVFFIAT